MSRTRNTRLAVVSIICSLLGVLFGAFSVVGVGLGVIAYERNPDREKRRNALALASIACGALTLLINLFLVVLVLGG